MTKKTHTSDTNNLADDILRGATEIAAFTRMDVRKAFHLLSLGKLPATKEGQIWVTTKSRLRRFYNESRFDAKTREVA